MSRKIGTIKDRDTGTNIDITEEDDASITFAAGATIDGDGANGQAGQSPCYAPSSYPKHTLDVIANAGGPGDWYGVVTDNGESNGTPIVQKQTDPAPGAYVSATSLHLPDQNGNPLPAASPFKYVDSATVPFIVVPPMIIQGVRPVVLGCRCVVTNTRNNKSTEAVVADVGPHNHIGEISVACAKAIGVPLGNPHEANGGGAPAPTIHYQLFPGTSAVVNNVTYPLQQS